MPSLREIQVEFISGILSGDDALLRHISAGGLDPSERLSVYRNNCREGFLAALTAGYPVLKRLAGDDYFRQLVREYQRQHPSPSGNLFFAGARLPAYLARRFTGTRFDYFSDVAALEWACQEVLSAADHPGLDLGRLAAVTPAHYAQLCFGINPAARLVASGYPVVRIWEAHQEAREPDTIDISSGGEQAIVLRRAAGVVVYRLPVAEYACLTAFRSGQALGRAAEDAQTIDAGFDLAEALRRWATLAFIVDFSLLGPSPDP